MTLSEIEASARNRYNAIGDTNWSSAEIANLVYEASLEMTRDCGLVIEKRFQVSTVSGTSRYNFPDTATSIKRITHNGSKLKEISMREDDILTIENQLSTDTGVPQYYYVWDSIFHLRPVPSAVYTLDVYVIANEAALTPSSTLTIPTKFHGSLVTYVVKEMSSKDLNWQMYDRYQERWEVEKLRIRSHIRRAKRGDAFTIVKLEELLPTVSLGTK
jgi:hypothetical protein